MELSNLQLITGLGFLIALILGAVANRTHFCTMGAVSDWVNMGLKGRMAAWVLAMGIAIVGVQILELTGLVDIGSSIYRTSRFGIGGYVIGGILFGIGMTLSGGCGQRTLVRLGNGNLKSLVVALVLGISAYMTLRGLFGVIRVEAIEPMTIDLAEQGIADQGIASLVASVFGWESSDGLRWAVAGLFALLFIGWSLKQSSLRESGDNILSGVVVGLAIVAAWAVTGILGADDFDPIPAEGLSFVAPTGNAISYLMTYTGATINFGIAVVFGIITGSFLYGIVSRTFSIETFTDRGDMINHLIGAVLMGFGGVLALGCTLGQGVSGVSTLALGSFVALLSIIFGSAMTMKVQYHMMDDMGFFKAFLVGLADILIPWRKTT